MPLLNFSTSQLLLAFVSASILHKLTFSRFFIKWLARHKFVCYLVPSNNELMKLKDGVKGSSKKNLPRPKSRLKRTEDRSREEFKIQTQDLENLKLEKAIASAQDIELITFSLDLEWIADLSIMSIFSFIMTELQSYFYYSTNEFNFSLIWAIVVICYSIKTLWKLTSVYFKNEQSIGERSICIVSGCMFLVFAMILLITDENRLEFGLESAYASFNMSATEFVKNNILTADRSRAPSRPVSFLMVKFCIAIVCALTGVLFTFPGMRFGQLYNALLDGNETTTFRRIMHNLNYLSPLFVVLLWVKPLTRDIIAGQSNSYFSDESFDSMRIYCLIIISFFRLYQLPIFISAFLASANSRLNRIKQRGGTTTNRDIQISISSIYNYVNVMIIQYILPILMCLFSAILYKSMGQFSWCPWITKDSYENSPQTQNATSFDSIDDFATDKSVLVEDLVQDSTLQNGTSNLQDSTISRLVSFTDMINYAEFKQIFSASVFRGILGFSIWWLHLSWFCTSTAGIVYHNYFSL